MKRWLACWGIAAALLVAAIGVHAAVVTINYYDCLDLDSGAVAAPDITPGSCPPDVGWDIFFAYDDGSSPHTHIVTQEAQVAISGEAYEDVDLDDVAGLEFGDGTIHFSGVAVLMTSSGFYKMMLVAESNVTLQVDVQWDWIGSLEPPPSDERINGFGSEGAVYAEEDSGIQIYAIDENSQGHLVVHLSLDELAGLPIPPEENLLLAQSADGKFSLYLLTTGEYQVNIGPDAEGKVQVTIFDGVPPTQVYHQEFFLPPP